MSAVLNISEADDADMLNNLGLRLDDLKDGRGCLRCPLDKMG